MFSFRPRPVEDGQSLLERAAVCSDFATLQSLGADALHRITQTAGVDFATALLFDRWQKSSEHAEFIRRINSLRRTPPGASAARLDAKVVIVPGALYIERPDIGGDGRLVREIAGNCGLRSDLIPLASVGPVMENAGRICGWLAQHGAEKTILVSLSKGGAELKVALASPDAPALFRNVAAWINVCGPLNGTRLANWILDSRIRAGLLRLEYKLRRRDFRFITELRHGAGAPLDIPLQLPPHMKLVSIVGFPLRQHLTTRFSRFCHRTLAARGPNDGTTMLSDLRDWPGEIYPAWGMDHYFRPEREAGNLIAAVIQHLAES